MTGKVRFCRVPLAYIVKREELRPFQVDAAISCIVIGVEKDPDDPEYELISLGASSNLTLRKIEDMLLSALESVRRDITRLRAS